MNSRYKVHNQEFTNFAYARLKNSTPEERNRLSIEERRIFKSDLSLAKFCRSESKETLDYTLTKIGVQWVQVYASNEADIEGIIFNSFEQSSFPKKRADMIDRMADKQIFVTNSSAQMVSLHIAAQNCHSKVYQVSQIAKEMVENKVMFKKIKKEVEGRDAERAYEEYTHLLCNLINSFGWIESNINISQNEMLILSILFNNRNKAINNEQIAAYIHLSGKIMYVGKFLDSLLEKELIKSDREPGRNKHFQKKTCYIISSLGIAEIIKYYNYIHEITFGKKKKRNNL